MNLQTTTKPGVEFFEIASARLYWIYFCISMVIGIGFLLIVPPNGAPDELAHTSKAIRVAQGNFFGISDIPTPDIFAWYYPIEDSRMITNPKFSKNELKATFRRPLPCTPGSGGLHNGVASYSPLLYLASAATIKVGCSTGMRFGTFLRASRLLNLLCASVLISLAIYWGGAGRWPIFTVGLLPPFIYQTASISGDSLFLGIAMLLIGLTIGSAGKLISPRRFAALTLLAALSAFSKPGYVWLGLLPLVLYADFLRSGWSRWRVGLCFILIPICFQLALLYLSRGATPIVPGINPSANLEFLLHHPWSFFVALAMVPWVYPFSHQWNIFLSTLGKVGWLSISPGPLAYMASATFLLLSSSLQNIAINKRVRLGIWLVATVSCIVISLPLYIFASNLNPEAVAGLQGRYFFPTLALFLIAFQFNAAAGLRTAFAGAILAGTVAVLLWSLWVTRNFYYV